MKSLFAAILAVFCLTGVVQAQAWQNKPVATANGIAITRGEFLATVAQMPDAEKKSFTANRQEEGRKLVNKLVSLQLLAQLAEESGLANNPTLRKRVKEIEQSVQAVKGNSQTPTAHNYLVANTRLVLANAMLAAAEKDTQILVTQQSLERYYARHQRHYSAIGIPSFQEGKPLFRAFLISLAEKDLHDFLNAQAVVEIFPLQ